MNSDSPEVTYLFTTFPKTTEMFLQREIAALRAKGVRLRIHSMWGGGGSFRGMPVESFIQTGERTLVSYLVKPLHDQIMRSMREK